MKLTESNQNYGKIDPALDAQLDIRDANLTEFTLRIAQIVQISRTCHAKICPDSPELT